MSPKEKAIDLVDSFIQQTRNKWELSMSYERAKNSALIAVYEILKTIGEIFETFEERKYWEEVKTEIQKL